MTARYSYAEPLAKLRGTQSSFGRASRKHRRRGDDWQDALVRRVQLELAKAERGILALWRDAQARAVQTKRRRAA